MNTQKQDILNHLQKYGAITPAEAWRLYGVYRLSAVIFELRKNYSIATFNMEGTDRHGNPTRFAKYVWGEKNGEKILLA